MTLRRVDPLGDSAVLVEFDAAPEAALRPAIVGFCAAVQARAWPFVHDLVPGVQSVCIHYDPVRLAASGWPAPSWFAALAALDATPATPSAARLQRLPICYEAGFGLDLERVAGQLGLSVDAVIERHAAALYQVVMIGFAPGFPYLAGLPESLHVPRRASPRSAVPAGSVAIAQDLCGIYPVQLPGGWHVVGRTPVRLFDPYRDPPSLLRAGDQVRFTPVDRRGFEALCTS